ncbi:hypothetical protein [Leptolyngbya sp. NIES-2104]|uniref:hypothetical protein n=1 Tax=Leptolyngbya sp. NIES-2104 TaxID=1552121 RepID=UPI0006EC9DE1|nr:hypothetical protein [Leptolyngbya sp. NIES-2104]GAP94773.1 erythrocyte membrane protein 1 [Leptolyngbya sp. NIES-2104]
MAFSVSTKRSKTQDSPTFWLSLIAGSLALHLVLLLVGRWYFSQAASAPSGTGQAPLDFVEIDPTVPPLKGAKPIAPSNTQTELPKAAPPQDSVTEPTQAPNTIANLPRQAAPERSLQPRITPSPSPTPTTPSNSQTGQLPTEQPKPTRSPAPRPTTPSAPPTGGTNSGTSSPGSSGSSQPNGGSSGGSTTQPSDSPNSGSSQPNGGSSGGSTTQPSDSPNSGTTQPGGSSSSGGNSGTSLSEESTFQGKIAQTLERDPNERQKDGALSITVKNEAIPPITLTFPSQLPVQVLDLKVFVVMDKEGRVFKTDVRDDSPSFLTNPELKDPEVRGNIQATVDQLLANTDNLFEVKPEANTSPDQLFSRIAQIQLKVSR